MYSSQDSFGDFLKQCGWRVEEATALTRQAEEDIAQALSDLSVQLQKPSVIYSYCYLFSPSQVSCFTLYLLI